MEMGLTQKVVKYFSSRMSAREFSEIANFKLTCGMLILPTSWAEDQVKAFLIYINYKFCATEYLNHMLKTIKKSNKRGSRSRLQVSTQSKQGTKR